MLFIFLLDLILTSIRFVKLYSLEKILECFIRLVCLNYVGNNIDHLLGSHSEIVLTKIDQII